MFKASFKNILLYILLKYLLFFVFAMFMTNNFKLLRFYNLRTGEDWFYYLWLILFFPILSMIFFSAPIYFSFRLKNIVYFILAIMAIIVAEYFVYVFFTSERHLNMKGVYNGIISLLVFYIFFFKQIFLILRHKT
jgi:hypothetical protein